MIEQQITVLKDDGCNTNMMLKSFVNKNHHLLKITKISVTINHSNRDMIKEASEIVADAKIEIESNKYMSNWIIADFRYDVLLRLLWHVECQSTIDYNTEELRAGNIILPSSRHSGKKDRVHNIGVKKFRSLLRKKRKNTDDFSAFQLKLIKYISSAIESMNSKSDDENITALMTKFSLVFRNDLPDGFPPERDINHKIEVKFNLFSQHEGIFQLLPAETLATKEYVSDLLNKGTIRPSKSPHGVPLFFVKQKVSLRGVIDYRALNRITKHNKTPILRTDKMSDRIGQAQYFSKLDLRSGFHQIRIAPEDIEITTFKTMYGHIEFLVMLMGLENALSTFQGLMNSIFRDSIDEFLVIYMEDILIFSDTREDHIQHLTFVFTNLREIKIYV